MATPKFDFNDSNKQMKKKLKVQGGNDARLVVYALAKCNSKTKFYPKEISKMKKDLVRRKRELNRNFRFQLGLPLNSESICHKSLKVRNVTKI